MPGVIAHFDIDYFYAQVEEVENPSLKDRPLIVCVFSGRTEDSGVVATSNYKAREFGVNSGMPIVLAKRKLDGKQPVVVRMNHAKYEVVSERVMSLLRTEGDALEVTGIDEAYLDVTKKAGGDYSQARALVEQVKNSILDSEHLSCSAGVGRSKAVAKLASDMAKPGGLIVVEPSKTEEFMSGLPVEKLYGVGPKSVKVMHDLGIATIGDLAKASAPKLEDSFGKKLATYFHAASNGVDDDPVLENTRATQLMRIVTLKENTVDAEQSMSQLVDAISDLRARLRSQNFSFRTLTAIAILTDLSTKTRSKTFETPIGDLSAVEDEIKILFEDLSDSVDVEFRRVGIRISDLKSIEGQSSLSEFVR